MDNLKVLVVEDNESINRILCMQLDVLGVSNIVSFRSIQEAKLAIENMPFDGAFLDLVLPDGSGIEVGKLCVEYKIPVVFITGMDDEYNEMLMLDIGWVLRKPVPVTALKRAVTYFRELKR